MMKVFLFFGLMSMMMGVNGRMNKIRGSQKIIPREVELATQGKDKNGNDLNEGTPTLSGLTLGDVYDYVVGNTDGDGISPSNAACENREYVDVIVIGAGMAGVRAATTLQAADPNINYIVLESQNRVGGRMRSTTFGEPTNARTIEDGANWIIQMNNNPVLDKAIELGIVAHVNDYDNVAAYDEFGVPIPQATIMAENERFLEAWEEAIKEADNQWAPDHEQWDDQGVIALLAKNGWEIGEGQQGNLDFTTEWHYMDFEYAARDTSVRYFPYYFNTALHVNDMRGFEEVPQAMFRDDADMNKLRTSTRVNKINYDENVGFQGNNYRVMVNAEHTEPAVGEPTCTDYYAKRVISTVSAGVIANDLIEFNPPLEYPHVDYNPYYMTQYVKIFYQFDSQFWDDNELIRVVRDVDHRGHCHHWANMNGEGFYPDSNMIRCEIMTEAFDELKDPITEDLTNATLNMLLDPLRTAYGEANVPEPLQVYYPKLNKDRDFGYGAYANWKTGFTFKQYAHMYGGVDGVVDYCEHNGCNSMGDWTMILSGSHTCYDQAEFTHGAYFAGEKAANQVLRELGYTGVDESLSPCDIDWHWLS
ncbi:Polyamine oxidase [Seminavis robusta]|uniref:Polyamine oxidase n=1 Tax=Seminavis robusta TaxID=568900 RepID=A0A9N8EIL6_9STRA|nr:Polyamine oxidase [Seminavis robusta]|eukprot:Sro1258_g256830.1 Polyamine oxidase (589) ;mRNA; r:18570-20698